MITHTLTNTEFDRYFFELYSTRPPYLISSVDIQADHGELHMQLFRNDNLGYIKLTLNKDDQLHSFNDYPAILLALDGVIARMWCKNGRHHRLYGAAIQREGLNTYRIDEIGRASCRERV